MLLAPLVLLLLLGFTAYWIRRRRFFLDLTENVPTLPGELPLLGHSLQFVGNTDDLYRCLVRMSKAANKENGVIKNWIGPCFSMLISEPTISQFVLNKLPKSFLYSFTKDWMGSGLIVCLDETIHRRHRKMLNPCFTQQVINGYLGVINQQARCLVERIAPFQGKGYFDHLKLISDFSFYTFCQTMMGIDASEATAGEYQRQIDRMLELLIRRCTSVWLYPDFLYKLSSNYREYEKIYKSVHRESNEFIEQRRAKHRANKKIYKDHESAFVDVLLEEEEAGNLTPRQLRDEVEAMIVGGYDSTASVLSLLLVLIGSHPAVQEQLIEEINNVFGDSNRDVNKEDIAELVYMEAFIKEALRVYPPATVIAKDADKTYEINGVVIPKGTCVIVSLWGLNRAGWGPDAHLFRPERWFEPEHGCFVSFSQGKRVCLGRSFAMTTLKTGLVHLLRHFRFTGNIHDVVMDYGFICKPLRGHFISCESVHTTN